MTCSYEPDGLGIKFGWGRDSPQLSRPARGPFQFPVKWVPGMLPKTCEIKCRIAMAKAAFNKNRTLFTSTSL